MIKHFWIFSICFHFDTRGLLAHNSHPYSITGQTRNPKSTLIVFQSHNFVSLHLFWRAYNAFHPPKILFFLQFSQLSLLLKSIPRYLYSFSSSRMLSSKMKVWWLYFLLLQKIIILVLLLLTCIPIALLTCIPIALQKCSRAYKCICNPWADLEINAISSAYKRSFITNSPNQTPSPPCKVSHSSSLSIYRPKRVGDRGQPCLTPMSLLKLSEIPADVLILTFSSS